MRQWQRANAGADCCREQRDKQMERAKHQERERERERLEQLEKQRVATDQAVQKHFEESLRLAHQKVSTLRRLFSCHLFICFVFYSDNIP